MSLCALVALELKQLLFKAKEVSWLQYIEEIFVSFFYIYFNHSKPVAVLGLRGGLSV